MDKKQEHELEALGAYTVPQIARLWNCGERKIWDEINSGRLASFNVGRLVRVPTEALADYQKRHAPPRFDAKVMAKAVIG